MSRAHETRSLASAVTTAVSPRENACLMRLVAFSLASNLPFHSLTIPIAPLWASAAEGDARLKVKAANIQKAVAFSLSLDMSALLTNQDKALILLTSDHAHLLMIGYFVPRFLADLPLSAIFLSNS